MHVLSMKLHCLNMHCGGLHILHDHCHTTAGKAKRVLCMCGAGLSVSAGIPDFRTPGTGLYSNLQKFDLPYPEAVFEINYFKRNPAPFFMLAKVEHPA